MAAAVALVILLGGSSCDQRPPPPPAPPTNAELIRKSLMITDLSVVEDQARTVAPGGAWTFARLMTDMAPPGQAGAFVKDWLRTWEQPQTVSNGAQMAARPGIRAVVSTPWMARDGHSGGDMTTWQPNLANAPFRLLAIVFRPDLAIIRNNAMVRTAEARFVFGVTDASGAPLPFTVIFEYGLVAPTVDAMREWARDWSTLAAMAFGPAYNAALQQVTDRFAGRGAAPAKPGGNALNQLRTNEIALTLPPNPGPPLWELREFTLEALAAVGGAPVVSLRPATVKQNPEIALNGTETLARFINDNEARFKDRAFMLPPHHLGAPFLAASSLIPFNLVWNGPGIRDNQARHLLALGTCNGCHHRESGRKADSAGTNVGFLHIGVRNAGQSSKLSFFLDGGQSLGITPGDLEKDPVGGEPRPFNDLESRAELLKALLANDLVRFQSTGAQRAFRVH